MDSGGHRAPEPVKLLHSKNLQKSKRFSVLHSNESPRMRGGIQPTGLQVASQCFNTDGASNVILDSPRNSAVMPILFYYQNVRGLRTKIVEFMLNVMGCPYDCIILTETWLNDEVCSAQLFGSEYVVYRSDRCPANSEKLNGGGIIIAVNRSLPSTLLLDAMDDSLEQLFISIKTESKVTVVGALYIAPNLRNEVEIIERHLSSVERAIDSIGSEDDLLLFGDYNRSGLSWVQHPNSNHLVIDALHSSINEGSSQLIDGIALHDLYQINHVANLNGRLLDLIFVNRQAKSACNVERAVDVLSNIDTHHPPLMVSFARNPSSQFTDEIDMLDFDFRKGDYDAINAALIAFDWTCLTNLNIDDAVAGFSRKIREVIEEYVPHVRPRQKPPWGNGELRRLNRRRRSTLRSYQRTRNALNHARFIYACRGYKALNKRLYGNYVQNTERNLRNNPKSFWRFINKKRKEEGLPSTMFLANNEATTSSDKCSLFATHFSSVFNSTHTTSDDISASLRCVPRNVFDADIFTITEEDVEKAIRKTKQSFYPGPDGIPAALLKKCSDALKSPLASLLTLSLHSGIFPKCWKSSFMFPIFKKGNKQNVENYRGITSLCALSKIFELIVYGHIMFRVKNYISTAQHGFYPGRSVSTNLLEFTSFCLRSLDQGYQIDAVYTDLKAAFDRVDHSILLAKLDKLGASARLVTWLSSYLRDRKMAVKLGSSVSDWLVNYSGVPQGSTLGPLLFSIFINDISRLLPPGTRLLYADDVKIYLLVQNSEDCTRLQDLIDMFVDWCRCNHMTVSIPKCFVISFHRKKQPLMFNYIIDEQHLQRRDCALDLGVLLDAQLSFRQHYTSIINKSNRQLGFVMRVGKEFSDPGTLRALYCSLVRSILETSCAVWDPHYAVWVQRIERVQKRFIYRVCRTLPWRDPENLPSYEDLCMLIGIDTLEKRRKEIIVKTAHRILLGQYDCPTLLNLLEIHCPRRPQRHVNFLRLGSHRTNYGMHEPIRNMAMLYNRSSSSLNF